MKLKNAARYFDDISIYDGYTGAFLFKGQASSYDGAQPDGTIAKRRVLSLAPGLLPPPRRAIRLLNEVWLMGDGNKDGIFDAPIRQSFGMKKVTDQFTVMTPGQAARNSGGYWIYGQKVYLKDTVDPLTTSDYDPFWNVYVAPLEGLANGYFLKSGQDLFRVRRVYDGLEGLTNGSADEVDAGAQVSATIVTKDLDLVTDEMVELNVEVPGLMIDLYKVYEYMTQADARNLAGDTALYVAKEDLPEQPVVGTEIRVQGLGPAETWRAFGVVSEQDAWRIHIRRA